ncbi:MAG TPA: type II secretion system protein [Vicinamibacterales bacterium]|nr:type II secretion system protein [Vicinamibacterales bacterium]
MKAGRCGGWTLIELFVVMTLVLILASVSLVVYGNNVQRAKEAALTENLWQMRKAIDEYYADKGRYPASLDALVTDKYLRSIPKDITGNVETWQEIPAEFDPGNPNAEPGIENVKSGSDQVSIDNTPYAEFE